jgi:flagellar hook-associated protein 2
LTQTVAAQNANLKVNGIAISKASNTITDAIQGVSLTLNNISSNSSTTSTLTVSHDTSGIQSAVSGFVDAYNALSNQLASRSAYGDATTPGGALAGDGTIRLIQNQLRDIFNTAAKGGTLAYLAQAGVSFQTDGTLKLDSNALNNAMSNNFSDVVNLFSSATGFATRLNTWASSVLDPSSGLIAIRTKSLNTSIQGYNDQITRLQSRMAILQQQYTAQYSNLNMLLTSMNNTSSYLTQQFAKGTSTG